MRTLKCESGQGLQLVNHWTPNDTLKDIELTSGYAEYLENAPMKSGGSEEGSEGTSKVLQAGCRRAWTVDGSTSISEAHAVSV